MSIDIDYALAIGLPAWTNADGVIGDTFNRVDSATNLGSTDIGGTHVWNQRVGTWGISGNQAYTSVSTIRSVATVGPTTVEDGLISVVLGQVGADTHGIVFRWVDTDNYLLMRANGDLMKRDAGVLSLLKASSALEAGLWLVHFNEGRIRVENGANGSTRLEHALTLAEHNKYSAANIHGLYINQSITVRFDDFRIEGLQVQSPAPRSVSIRRGRSRRYDPVAPAEAVVVLDNESGDLDPANPNGKHYPRLRKDTLILLRYNTGSANLLTRLQSYDIIDASHWRSVSNTTLSTIAFTTRKRVTPTRNAARVTVMTAATAADMEIETTDTVAVTAGTEYTFAVWTVPPVTQRARAVSIAWYDSAEVLLSVSGSGTLGADQLTHWSEVTVTATAPVGATQARPRLKFIAPAAGEAHYFDTAMLSVGPRRSWESPTTIELYQGYAEQWVADYGIGVDATATITATDALRLFAQKPIWPSLAEHHYLGGYNGAAPIHYWPLDEERNSDKFETLRDDGVVGGTRLVPRGPYQAGQTGRLPWDTRAMARVGDAGTQYQAIKQVLTGTNWNPDPGGDWTLEFTMFVDDPTFVQVLVTEDDASPMLQIWSDGGGGIQYRIFYTDSTNSQQGTPQARPGEFHHCALGVASDGSIFAYLDGVFQGSVAGGGKTPRAADQLYLGIQDNETSQLTGEIGRVAVFDYRRVSSGQITEQHTAYRNPWGSESPGTRSVRLLDDIDDLIDRFAWPRELNAIEFPSERTILPMMGGGTLLEYLREMERSESGLLYVDRSGVVVLIKRSQIIPSPPAVATYSDSGAAGTTPYQTVSFRPNPDLVNTVEATIRPLEARQTAVDTASVNQFGEQKISITVANDTLDEAKDAAADIVSRNATTLRIVELTIATHDPAVSASITGTHQPGQIIRVETTLPQYVVAQNFEILEVSHDIGPQEWYTTIRALEVSS